jgi:hypothetical protein
MRFATLSNKKGPDVGINYDFKSTFNQLVTSKQVDSFIFSTQLGFSPLGIAMSNLTSMKFPGNTQQIADWNRFENNKTSLVGIENQQLESNLKGILLAPCENSICYIKKHDRDYIEVPNKNFYYNVTFESIKYLVENFNARNIAITHLSSSGNYHDFIAMCTLEALGHFNDLFPNKIDTFHFVGCCIEERHLRHTGRLSSENGITTHRDIKTRKEEMFGFDLLTLDYCN